MAEIERDERGERETKREEEEGMGGKRRQRQREIGGEGKEKEVGKWRLERQGEETDGKERRGERREQLNTERCSFRVAAQPTKISKFTDIRFPLEVLRPGCWLCLSFVVIAPE